MIPGSAGFRRADSQKLFGSADFRRADFQMFPGSAGFRRADSQKLFGSAGFRRADSQRLFGSAGLCGGSGQKLFGSAGFCTADYQLLFGSAGLCRGWKASEPALRVSAERITSCYSALHVCAEGSNRSYSAVHVCAQRLPLCRSARLVLGAPASRRHLRPGKGFRQDTGAPSGEAALRVLPNSVNPSPDGLPGVGWGLPHHAGQRRHPEINGCRDPEPTLQPFLSRCFKPARIGPSSSPSTG